MTVNLEISEKYFNKNILNSSINLSFQVLKATITTFNEESAEQDMATSDKVLVGIKSYLKID